jgi:hypothetical protein
MVVVYFCNSLSKSFFSWMFWLMADTCVGIVRLHFIHETYQSVLILAFFHHEEKKKLIQVTKYRRHGSQLFKVRLLEKLFKKTILKVFKIISMVYVYYESSNRLCCSKMVLVDVKLKATTIIVATIILQSLLTISQYRSQSRFQPIVTFSSRNA